MKQGLLRRLAAVEQKFGKFASTQSEVWGYFYWTFPYYVDGLEAAVPPRTEFEKLLDYQSEDYKHAIRDSDEAVLNALFMDMWERVFSHAKRDLKQTIASAPALA